MVWTAHDCGAEPYCWLSTMSHEAEKWESFELFSGKIFCLASCFCHGSDEIDSWKKELYSVCSITSRPSVYVVQHFKNAPR